MLVIAGMKAKEQNHERGKGRWTVLEVEKSKIAGLVTLHISQAKSKIALEHSETRRASVTLGPCGEIISSSRKNRRRRKD